MVSFNHQVTEMLDKAIEEEARMQLAADRRIRLSEVEQWRRRIEMLDGQKRADEASRRRTAMLKDASQVCLYTIYKSRPPLDLSFAQSSLLRPF